MTCVCFREPYVIFSGGMPYDKASRTPSLTVMHAKNTTVLEMEHNVVDFLTLCNTPWNHGMYASCVSQLKLLNLYPTYHATVSTILVCHLKLLNLYPTYHATVSTILVCHLKLLKSVSHIPCNSEHCTGTPSKTPQSVSHIPCNSTWELFFSFI